MNPIQHLVRRAVRLWVLERVACSALLGTAWAINALLLSLLLIRRFDFPVLTLLVLPLLPLILLALRALHAAWDAPQGVRAAKLLDERAGTNDLFTSAMEFMRTPQRFGWLGELTCQKALASAARTRLSARWQLGTRTQWLAAGSTLAVLAGCYVLFVVAQLGTRESTAQLEASLIEKVAKAPPPSEDATHNDPSDKPKEEAGPNRQVISDDFAAAPQKEDAGEPEKITQEMLDRYMQNIPDVQEVNLEDISVAKWDMEELSGDKNQQNRRKDDEKIDPVKLDPTLLKDFENAKKTKAKEGEGSQNKGVDVAVQGTEAEGQKSKEGGDSKKKDAGQLAGAVSKDPRGNPSRLLIKLEKQGLAIISAVKGVLRQKGQDRPMNPFEFLALVKKAQPKARENDESGDRALKARDGSIRQEGLSERQAPLVERYFERLRKEDQ